YDPAWPARFEAERDRIRGALGPAALRVEHIGSTSVPGLAAKPVVDICLTVADVTDEAAFVAPLETAGYALRVREPNHRTLRHAERDVPVHVHAAGSPEVDRSLALRDRLRSSAADRAAYEALKRELAQRDWDDMNHYADAKGPFIEQVLAS